MVLTMHNLCRNSLGMRLHHTITKSFKLDLPPTSFVLLDLLHNVGTVIPYTYSPFRVLLLAMFLHLLMNRFRCLHNIWVFLIQYVTQYRINAEPAVCYC